MNFLATHGAASVDEKHHVFGDLLNICRRKEVDEKAVHCLETDNDKVI